MRTHNITTLASEIYDKLANNTDNDMFDPNEVGLEDMFVDENAGTIKGMLSIGLGDRYTEDDIYYYFMKGEKVPAVGETFELDDIKWERIK